MTDSDVYFGQVIHKRTRPFSHRLRYRVFSILVDLDEVGALGARLRLFSCDRWNLLSFRARDHGPRDGSPLRRWIDAKLAEAGIDLAGGRVRILCFPRMFGYAFNPLSVWYCHHADGRLMALLYEVSNTFGEHHSYLVPVTAGGADDVVRQTCAKGFHVSPFIGMTATYNFTLRPPADRLQLAIREDDAAGPFLFATHVGARRPFTDATLLRAMLAYPLMTLKVIAGIHWEALKMLPKGARYRRRPAAPTEPVTIAPAISPLANDPTGVPAE